ncbi:uncharacterized protein TNCV_1718191 [Trichonephila clavipes]|nr:uncharacterized protein TNCV_1718191 [Trichonephila clavipes]
MDQIDAFPEHISTTVVPVTLPKIPHALEYAARQGHVRACIIYQEPNTKRVFVLFCKGNWYQKKTLVNNFKRAIIEAKHVNEFRPDDFLWEKISKGLLRNPDRLLKNTEKRMVYIYNNMFFVKKDFNFGFRTVKSREIHLIQTTNVPMLIYEFPSSSLRCRANPSLFRRSFEPYDQMLYHRMVLEPHTAYPIPAGTHYILLTVQKTVWFGHYPRNHSPQLMENGFNLGDFRKMKLFDQKAYKIPPPTPAHVPAETNKRPLEQQPVPSSKRNRVFITPVIRPPELIARPSTALATPQPVSIPESPVLTTPQILLPDPPPVVETLEPTLMDATSMDKIMASVFGDYSPQGIHPAHTQEPQLLDTMPSLFDESNELISFLDNFETGLAIEQQEALMDLTMPRMKKKVKKTTGFKVIKPLDLSVRNCLPCM